MDYPMTHPTQIFVANAHPIGEEGDFVFSAVGWTKDQAHAALVAVVSEDWDAFDDYEALSACGDFVLWTDEHSLPQ